MKLKYFLAIGAIATSLVVFTAAEGGNAVEDQMKKINATVEADANEYMAQKKEECRAIAVRQAEANAAEVCATRSTKAVVAPVPVPVKGKPTVKPGKVVVKTTPVPTPTTVKPATPAPPAPVNNGKKVDGTNNPDAINNGRKAPTPAVDPNNTPEMINTGRRKGGGL